MRSTRNIRIAAFAAVAAVTLAAAPSARAQSLPTGKSLLEKHDAAVGGRAAMDKHNSMHVTVALTIAAANISGTIEEFHQKPNLFYAKQSFAGNESSTGFDGKTAWSLNAATGPMVLDSATSADMKTQANFFSDYYDPTRIKSAETVDVTDFEGQRCYRVKIVHKDDTESMIYLDSATGLRAGQMETAKMNGQPMQRTVVMSGYKDFGGVKMPVHRTIKLPMAEVAGEITAVEFDKVEPSTFALPDAVKALLKP